MQHGVAVGIRFRRHGLGDRSSCAATIFDDELLAEHLADLCEDDARCRVCAASRGIRHDHAHRPVRPRRLCTGRTREWNRGHPGQSRASRKHYW